MKKIVNLKTAAQKAAQARSQGQTVGLITGCFDILHKGHLDLFNFAKKNAAVLIIALDTDKAIKSGKGPNRPINSQKTRAKNLSEIESVDFVLPIEDDYLFTKESVEPVHDKIRDTLNPHYLITTPDSDPYWESKRERAELKGVKMLLFERVSPLSTTRLVEMRAVKPCVEK